MLCSRFKQILLTKTSLNNNVQFRCFINARFVSKRYGVEGFWASLTKHRNDLHIMSSVRLILKDLRLNRLWSAWSRSVLVGHVVKRCRKDRSVREVIQNFRQTLLRPRRSLLLYATAACKARDNDEKPGQPQNCHKGISDEDLEGLLEELDGIEELAKRTLYCENCNKRMKINNKDPKVSYCPCKDSHPPEGSPDGWEPYMEADDVIIWRKEYKKGQGLYAYKVYGRYKDVKAADFAAVNIDGAYRRKWDNAVAALAVVERNANGVPDQAVLHWEVLWPRLFANRDYVYIRRHKEYTVKNIHSAHLLDEDTIVPAEELNPTKKEPKQPTQPPQPPPEPETKSSIDLPDIYKSQPKKEPNVTVIPPKFDTPVQERSSVHDNAKKKSLEMYSKEPPPPPPPPPAPLAPPAVAASPPPREEATNQVYVIISRSCTHPDVPATRNAIRVSEYWSHMVVKTLDGPDKMGMEFVLTYYDEPAVGGMPSGVTAWATGRAAPAFLAAMRAATQRYQAYRRGRAEETPDFTPFSPEVKKISHDEELADSLKEEDMESSKTGPDMDNGNSKDESTQTEECPPPHDGKLGANRERQELLNVKDVADKAVGTRDDKPAEELPTRPSLIVETEKTAETEDEQNTNTASWWWRPFYYFG